MDRKRILNLSVESVIRKKDLVFGIIKNLVQSVKSAMNRRDKMKEYPTYRNQCPKCRSRKVTDSSPNMWINMRRCGRCGFDWVIEQQEIPFRIR